MTPPNRMSEDSLATLTRIWKALKELQTLGEEQPDRRNLPTLKHAIIFLAVATTEQTSEQGDGAKVGPIATMLNLAPSTVSRIVVELSNRPTRPGDTVRYGLLQDAPNPKHFGQNLIVLTPKGCALVRKFL
jgi:DNA-binding MarR family transcriptional regulator